MRSISVLIADDSESVRNVLKSKLIAKRDLKVVGAVGSKEELFKFAGRRNPDIVLLDPFLSDDDWPSLLHELQQRSPRSRIIVFPSRFDGLTDVEAFKNGADGYIQKTPGALGEILQAIFAVAHNDRYPGAQVYAPDRIDELSLQGEENVENV
jgi:DNA-binding NarL/FixJ family response regulator